MPKSSLPSCRHWLYPHPLHFHMQAAFPDLPEDLAQLLAIFAALCLPESSAARDCKASFLRHHDVFRCAPDAVSRSIDLTGRTSFSLSCAEQHQLSLPSAKHVTCHCHYTAMIHQLYCYRLLQRFI